MIFVTYRRVCLAFLKQLWSSIRHALPVVTWRSRAVSDVVPASPAIAHVLPAAPPHESTVTTDALGQVVTHLEYLGYEIQPAREGWNHAQHPYRYDFYFRLFAQGVRLHCNVGIGASIGNSRAAWLEFLNTANERGQIAQFSLFEGETGGYGVRMWAFVSGAYSRPAFATAMDMWQNDLDLVRRKPEFRHGSDTDEGDDVAAVTVN